jgi:hypothetical protein
MISLANDAVEAYTYSGPAVKILAFGVSEGYKNRGIGRNLIQFIQAFFVIRNKTGCRFVTVDAYNIPGTLRFYTTHCGFIPLDAPGQKTSPFFYDLLLTKNVLDEDQEMRSMYSKAIEIMMATGETKIDVPDKAPAGT